MYLRGFELILVGFRFEQAVEKKLTDGFCKNDLFCWASHKKKKPKKDRIELKK
jgi:hypothetical protein